MIVYKLHFCILALGSGQRLLYRLGSGLGLVLVLVLRCNAIAHTVLHVPTSSFWRTCAVSSLPIIAYWRIWSCLNMTLVLFCSVSLCLLFFYMDHVTDRLNWFDVMLVYSVQNFCIYAPEASTPIPKHVTWGLRRDNVFNSYLKIKIAETPTSAWALLSPPPVG